MSELVVVQTCKPETSSEEVAATVQEMVSAAVPADKLEKLSSAKKVFVKPNLGINRTVMFKNRFTNTVDVDVFQGVAEFLRAHTDAEIIYGDGMGDVDIAQEMKERGYHPVAEKNRMRLVDMNAEPYSNFSVPNPTMFTHYTLSRELEDVDYVVSIAKMKSHHLCGVTLTQKNLFGIPPTPVYGYPRIALHSSVRLPLLLVDLAQLFPPDLCIVDGIIGGNFSEWQGDPISSGLLLAGTNCVAVDATAARLMHVDPTAHHRTAPFIVADNHIRIAHEHGLGPVSEDSIHVEGELPESTFQYSCSAVFDKRLAPSAIEHFDSHCSTARGYFENAEKYIDRYGGETIMLNGAEVIHHSPLHKGFVSEFWNAIKEHNVGMYEVFTKSVMREEAELQTPYMR